ncbi:MAG TPA: Uma2 family endonuclease [Acidisarcina sp.]
MATAAGVSIETYLRTEYEPDAEYIDGEIEERATGEDDHSAWQAAIQKWFFKHEEEWDVRVRPELRVQTSPTRFRVPDVSILDAQLPREPIATHPPIAVFEILSPEDTLRRLTRKLRDYAGMGIPEIWVIDPETGLFSRFEEDQLMRRTHFHHAGMGIEFPMAEITVLVR